MHTSCLRQFAVAYDMEFGAPERIRTSKTHRLKMVCYSVYIARAILFVSVFAYMLCISDLCRHVKPFMQCAPIFILSMQSASLLTIRAYRSGASIHSGRLTRSVSHLMLIDNLAPTEGVEPPFSDPITFTTFVAPFVYVGISCCVFGIEGGNQTH